MLPLKSPCHSNVVPTSHVYCGNFVGLRLLAFGCFSDESAFLVVAKYSWFHQEFVIETT